MKIPYYPGCTLNTVAKDFDTSAKESARAVGFEMEDLEQWNCCGASFPLTPDNIMGLSAPAKVLSGAKKAGDTLTTLCSVCYNVLKRTNKVMQDDKTRRKSVNEFMEDDYDGSLKIVHYLEVLRDDIGFAKLKETVTKPLEGIKAGAYYGCMLLRPFDDIGIDNAEAPTIMEDMLKALGATPVEFPDKIECCGAHLAMNNKEVVTRLSGNVIDSAVREGAEIIVTTCPLCQYNLESVQESVGATAAGVPIVYFTQLLGLALGQDIEQLGFDANGGAAKKYLKRKGLL
ncbi:MAG: CoB--CoM heterodisulfide reductase iron-sulfur subunit B family protein [Proteobacteria bacterium]|nr:CoB--CoM heterodisulfide reductase iron-sulfur subunit B family protein [Pseudomonadota bacterium]